jgi:hypothetical protein
VRPSRAADRRQLLAGAAVAGGVQALLALAPPGGPQRWTRTNHRGRSVSLLSGPAVSAAAAATAAVAPGAAAVAGLGACLIGRYDDVAGAREAQRLDKGLRGHVAALREGRVSAGVVKVVGIGAVGLLSARLTGWRRGAADVVLDGALVAVSANLLNLLDLRPGRALKVALAAAVALGQPGPAGAALALLPGDLAEQTMLGDAGANGLGAVLGLALAGRCPGRRSRLLALVAGSALTAASEVVSYSRVIDRVPPLRVLDGLGRLP